MLPPAQTLRSPRTILAIGLAVAAALLLLGAGSALAKGAPKVKLPDLPSAAELDNSGSAVESVDGCNEECVELDGKLKSSVAGTRKQYRTYKGYLKKVSKARKVWKQYLKKFNAAKRKLRQQKRKFRSAIAKLTPAQRQQFAAQISKGLKQFGAAERKFGKAEKKINKQKVKSMPSVALLKKTEKSASIARTIYVKTRDFERNSQIAYIDYFFGPADEEIEAQIAEELRRRIEAKKKQKQQLELDGGELRPPPQPKSQPRDPVPCLTEASKQDKPQVLEKLRDGSGCDGRFGTKDDTIQSTCAVGGASRLVMARLALGSGCDGIPGGDDHNKMLSSEERRYMDAYLAKDKPKGWGSRSFSAAFQGTKEDVTYQNKTKRSCNSGFGLFGVTLSEWNCKRSKTAAYKVVRPELCRAGSCPPAAYQIVTRKRYRERQSYLDKDVPATMMNVVRFQRAQRLEPFIKQYVRDWCSQPGKGAGCIGPPNMRDHVDDYLEEGIVTFPSIRGEWKVPKLQIPKDYYRPINRTVTDMHKGIDPALAFKQPWYKKGGAKNTYVTSKAIWSPPAGRPTRQSIREFERAKLVDSYLNKTSYVYNWCKMMAGDKFWGGARCVGPPDMGQAVEGFIKHGQWGLYPPPKDRREYQRWLGLWRKGRYSKEAEYLSNMEREIRAQKRKQENSFLGGITGAFNYGFDWFGDKIGLHGTIQVGGFIKLNGYNLSANISVGTGCLDRESGSATSCFGIPIGLSSKNWGVSYDLLTESVSARYKDFGIGYGSSGFRVSVANIADKIPGLGKGLEDNFGQYLGGTLRHAGVGYSFGIPFERDENGDGYVDNTGDPDRAHDGFIVNGAVGGMPGLGYAVNASNPYGFGNAGAAFGGDWTKYWDKDGNTGEQTNLGIDGSVRVDGTRYGRKGRIEAERESCKAEGVDDCDDNSTIFDRLEERGIDAMSAVTDQLDIDREIDAQLKAIFGSGAGQQGSNPYSMLVARRSNDNMMDTLLERGSFLNAFGVGLDAAGLNGVIQQFRESQYREQVQAIVQRIKRARAEQGEGHRVRVRCQRSWEGNQLVETCDPAESSSGGNGGANSDSSDDGGSYSSDDGGSSNDTEGQVDQCVNRPGSACYVGPDSGLKPGDKIIIEEEY